MFIHNLWCAPVVVRKRNLLIICSWNWNVNFSEAFGLVFYIGRWFFMFFRLMFAHIPYNFVDLMEKYLSLPSIDLVVLYGMSETLIFFNKELSLDHWLDGNKLHFWWRLKAQIPTYFLDFNFLWSNPATCMSYSIVS